MPAVLTLPPSDFRTWLKGVWKRGVDDWDRRNGELTRAWKDLLQQSIECYFVIGTSKGPEPGSGCLASASVGVVISETIELMRIVLDPTVRGKNLGTRLTQAIVYCETPPDDPSMEIEIADGAIHTWQNGIGWHQPGVAEFRVGVAFGRYWYDKMPDRVRELYFDLCETAKVPDAREEFALFFALQLFQRKDLAKIKQRASEVLLRDRVAIIENEVRLLSLGLPIDRAPG